MDIEPIPSRRLSPTPLPDELRDELGVMERFPKDLEEAVEALQVDVEVFERVMGEKCVEAYMRLKMEEINKAKEKTLSERRKAIIGFGSFPFE